MGEAHMHLVESIFCFIDAVDPVTTIFVAYENEDAVEYSIPTERLEGVQPEEGSAFWVDYYRDDRGGERAVLRRYEEAVDAPPPNDYLMPDELRALADR